MYISLTNPFPHILGPSRHTSCPGSHPFPLTNRIFIPIAAGRAKFMEPPVSVVNCVVTNMKGWKGVGKAKTGTLRIQFEGGHTGKLHTYITEAV